MYPLKNQLSVLEAAFKLVSEKKKASANKLYQNARTL